MFIGKFPVQDRAEIFGLHKNAIVQRMTTEGKSLLERVFEFEFASKEITKATAILETNDAGLSDGGHYSSADSEKEEDKAANFKRRILTIIQELPELLDEDVCNRLYPISYEHCFNTLIKKEVQRYNMLMQVIYVSLKNTLKALEGVIHINANLEEVYKSLTYEHVPHTWHKYCYPTFKSLSLFLSNLQDRVAFIQSFLNDKDEEVDAQGVSEKAKSARDLKDYWLPGFFD
jgi:dynein heavy chain